ncbi:MAG: ComEC/Rec2 family competence protein [Eubacterium sp.]|nr:ComEC/Rec2 family competence protein [Eubacterium sp.]
MRKRPLCLAFAVFALLICLMRAVGAPIFGRPHLPPGLEEKLQAGTRLKVTATVADRQYKKSSIQYLLKNSTFTYRGQTFRIKKLIAYTSGDSEIEGESQEIYLPPEKDGARIPVIAIGSEVEFTGQVSEFAEAENPGQFDQKEYYASERIYYSIFATHAKIRIPRSNIKDKLSAIRTRASKRLSLLMTPDQAGTLSAMLTGDRQFLEEEDKLDYQMSGVMHVLAISGLHITLIGSLFFELLIFLNFPRPAAALISSAATILYCIFTGSPPSAVRAAIMFLVLTGAKLLYRTYDSLSALSLAGILMLAANPGQLFYSGFQLSYGAVIGAAALYPALLRIFPADYWRQGSRKKLRFERFLQLSLSWASISLFLFPLTAYYFYEVPLLSFFPNLIIVPCMSFVMMLGILGIIIGYFFSLPARVILLPVDAALHTFSLLNHTIRQIPGSTMITGQPALWQICLFYIVIYTAGKLICLREDRPEGKHVHMRNAQTKGNGQRKKRTNVLAYVPSHVMLEFSAFLAIFSFCLLFVRFRPSFQISALAVGQGDCIEWQQGDGTVFMMDGGSTSENSVGKYRIIPYLKQQGVREVEGIFLSHNDADHVNGIEELLQAIAGDETAIVVRNVFLPVWMKGTEDGSRLAAEAASAGASVRYLQQGDQIISGKLTIKVLHPLKNGQGEREGNAGSMVLKVSYQGFDALLTGDLEGQGEKEILSVLDDVEYLKVAHHGSRYSTSDQFLGIVKPEIAVISAPEASVYGHPHKETLERLEEAGARTLVTKDCGMIRVIVENQKYRITVYRKDRPK